MFTHSTKYCLLVPLISWPHTGLVGLLCIMTADAGVEFLAAKVLDGDDVQGRVPVGALGQLGDGEAVNDGSPRWFWSGRHVDLV